MNPLWLRALALVCIFGAVVLAVEVLVRWMASSRAEGKAINLRLKMIGKGRSHGETMNLLRRSGSAVPPGLPPLLDGARAQVRADADAGAADDPDRAADADDPDRPGRDLLPDPDADGRRGHGGQLRPDRDERRLCRRARGRPAADVPELPRDPHAQEDAGAVPGRARRVRPRAFAPGTRSPRRSTCSRSKCPTRSAPSSDWSSTK